MIRWLRENVVASGMLAIIRIYVGVLWLTAGWGKVTGGFDASGYLKGAVANPVMSGDSTVYPTFTAFLERFALPNVKWINILIPWGEVLVGLGLILGALTTAAVFFGLVMNFMFLFAGTVSSNPWYVLLSVIVLMAGANAGRFGLDYYIIPWVNRVKASLIERKKTEKDGQVPPSDSPEPAHA